MRTVAEGAEGLPASSVPIARDESGQLYCLDAAASGPYGSPVYKCRPGRPDEALEHVGHDLPSWLFFRLAESS
jgi:hypothetical protein